ncbi:MULTISPECIES: aminotransferase class I/II-fold pyridoxal phosphate-dependent enzyme [Thermoanaerobacterium]|uniref:Orn/Lys/Arg decarboxylase major region n=2 Tax=Thermoanaerobacterium TaxID=28895 RepID=W9E886_9THEO|nr:MULTISPECIES: aminotransferase class I/II-fold pyridoxal phosphate-dependent enzyme [Thermoanaerobacterium]AFK85778.1 Orn/Lys/Arg decarboxylase major region [Thermoanaerobacterium saccharolyticum JW/SL-YS485]ETO38013.1 Orn/Lys/Arg decarboxylase major region [Thermoanaerobacterium aotearoense SCUT27]
MTKYTQNDAPLFEALKNYVEENVYAFHVPGHKHGKGNKEFTQYVGSAVMGIDVNSMEDLDNLANPVSVIEEAHKLAAQAFGADYAYFLVNGTTSGIQAMIMAATEPGDKIIMPRNAHKSAFSALILSGAIPVYLYPEIDEDLDVALGISVDKVQEAILANPDAKAVLILNPTYYGITSELEKIIHLAHENNMAVLCDEAHGSHFYFHPDMPPGGITLGADICALSIHKTGGSMTQSSLLLSKGDRVEVSSIKSILNLLQSTSASYVLMASLDVARKQLATKGEEILAKVIELSEYAREEINKIDGLKAITQKDIMSPYMLDPTKLVINVSKTGMTGYEIMRELRLKYHIQLEMADLSNIMAIISLGDEKDDVEHLIRSLKEFVRMKKNHDEITTGNIIRPEVIVAPRDAYYSKSRSILLDDAEGEICAEMIMAYPPGIPMICPGERITKDIIERVKLLKMQHCQLQGTEDPNIDHIKVLGHVYKV